MVSVSLTMSSNAPERGGATARDSAGHRDAEHRGCASSRRGGLVASCWLLSPSQRALGLTRW